MNIKCLKDTETTLRVHIVCLTIPHPLEDKNTWKTTGSQHEQPESKREDKAEEDGSALAQ